MTSTVVKFLAISALGLASIATSPVQAQQVYRIIGADGKVTFSDKPPVSDSQGKVTSGRGASGGVASSSLPFELRQIASKYPVTLYTGDNCAPCASAKSMLISRGIPFAEKTVNTSDDIQALQRLSGETSLPFATIGSQQLKGYSDAEWGQFLNAAGYPPASVLAASYRQPAATPLVAVATPPAPAAQGANAAPARAAGAAGAATPAQTGSNPAGIKF